MSPDLAILESALGHCFRRRGLLEKALTHPSARFEERLPADNQRLEFLGDATLGLVAADYLFKRFKGTPEGELTRLRSRVTNDQTLAELARDLGLGPYLRLGRGEFQSGGADRPSNLADALESILGALYLDGGMKAVRRLFMARFAPILDRLVVAPDLANPKGALQEHFQKTWKTEPQYRMKEERGPPHDRQYTAEVLRAQSVLGAGHGPSKQAAQVAAALEALRALGLLPEPMDATDPGPPGSCSAD